MSTTHYALYQKCFPDYPLEYEGFCSMTGIGDTAVLLEEREGDRLVGFALLGKSNLSLLAVDREYRNRGIGSRILQRAEEYLREQGVKEITLARGTNSIFQGVPTDNEGRDVSGFFAKRGYTGSYVTYNMELDTATFDYDALPFPKPEGVTYRLAAEEDRVALLKAAEEVVPDWVELYRGCGDDVLLALCDGEIASFAMLNEEGGIFTKQAAKHGSIGCVGTVPKYRKRGIGLDLTARAVQILKERGSDQVQLLYLVLDKWYGKVGFAISSTHWMAEKTLAE